MTPLLRSSNINHFNFFVSRIVFSVVSLSLLAILATGASALPIAVPKISFVTSLGSGAKTGLSWADASGDLQAMIDGSVSGDEVWVAGGDYNSPANHPFSMKEGVKIYGGFGGTETELGERDVTNAANLSSLVGKRLPGGPPGNSPVLNIINISNTAVLDGFVIRGSAAHGVQCVDSSPKLVNITISDNQNGGMHLVNSSPIMINCAIISNVADRNFSFGGGITTGGSSSPTLVNCLITNNIANYGGGILSTSSGTPVLINCTISGNQSRAGGHAIFTNVAIKLLNCIVFNNKDGSNRSAVSGPVIVKHSLVEGASADPANGNIQGNLNPLFSNGYQLQPCSPAVNTGSNTYYASGQTPDVSSITKDLSGSSRFSNDGKVDMGAFECHNVPPKSKPGVWYVKAGGTGSGVSWDCAFGELQAAIDGSSSGDQVWVAGGDYNSLANHPFSMKEGVQIYGGFGGTETELGERDLTKAANISSLVGKRLSGGPPANSAVLNIINISNTAVLDGFVIKLSGAHGVQCIDSSPKLVNVTITGNEDGGIHLVNSSPTMINCSIVSNNANINSYFGGGVSMAGSSSPTLVNCLITNNIANYGGGIQSSSSSTPALINCTITGNQSRSGGHAISTNVAIKLLNCIVFNNAGRPDRPVISGPLVIKHSLVEGTPADPANGNLPGDLNPLFSNGYQLQPCSPAVNTGSNTYYASGQTPDVSSITKDLSGNSRFYNDGTVDMGAFEYQGNTTVRVPGVWYVKAGGTGSGVSWDCPVGDLKLAINSASSGEQVWVAGGTFQPTDNGSFSMKEGVKIYGGFAGTEASLASRDLSIAANKSILQAYGHTVVYNSGAILTTAAVLDGFTIRGSTSAPAILNYSDGSPMLSNLIITENTAFGGMITTGSSPVLVNCSFTGNYGSSGGGMLISGGSPKLINCSFIGNSGVDGAGIFIDNASPILVNCLIKGNTATGGGGGMCISNSTTSVTNCTIVGNTASGQGGGILNRGTSPLLLRNSILYGNNTGLANLNPPAITSQYSLVQGIDAPNPSDHNIAGNTNPLFIDAAAGNYRLQPCSPLVNAGFNYFQSGLVPDLSGITSDLDIKPRMRESAVDIGAYEFSGASRSLAVDGDQAAVVANGDFMLTTQGAGGCRLLAYVSPNRTALSGLVTGKVWVAVNQPANYLKRHYQISPMINAAAATAKVTLYFTQQEFTDFNLVSPIQLPVDAADVEGYKANLRIEKRSGISNTEFGLPDSYTGDIETITPSEANGKVEWNADAGRWEVSFDVTGFSGFFVKTIQTPLPLNLINFTATHEAGSNLLQWSTASEINTDYFEVQSSRNAKNFIKIATVEAAGSGDFHYRYDDRTNYVGTIYYRLKMSDLDETYTYSKITSVAGDENFAGIYPNPAGAMVTFQVSDALLKTTANLFDITGRHIQSIVIKNNEQQINTKPLTNGIYILKFADGTVERFVKE